MMVMTKALHGTIGRHLRFASHLSDSPPPIPSIEKAVHEFRRRTKIIRALLAFYSRKDGKTIGAIHNNVTEASRILSSIRDAAVIRNTLCDLQSHNDCESFRELLKSRIAQIDALRQSSDYDEEVGLRKACLRLSQVTKFWESLPRRPARVELQQALSESYRDGRKSTKRWLQSHNVEDMHAVRKAVKRLSTQLRYLRKFGGDRFEPDVVSLAEVESKRLGSELGNVCDLHLVMTRLNESDSQLTDESSFEQLKNVLVERLARESHALTLRACRFYFGSSRWFLKGLTKHDPREVSMHRISNPLEMESHGES
jgi:CHAD domain-containing protein